MDTDSHLQITTLGLIAGKGAYPLELADSARKQGVKRIIVMAFKGETHRDISRLADEVHWLHVGQFKKFLELIEGSGIKHFVMAGQITPSNLFMVRPDKVLFELLRNLDEWNAHSIFGEICRRIEGSGVSLLSAGLFMEHSMPHEGVLVGTLDDPRVVRDMEYGLDVARKISALDVGQTIVVKDGAILAVEAFEGTDETIRRAGRVGGKGAVVIKVAKPGHDMRFDIPVMGLKTMKTMRRAGIKALVCEAGRIIILEKERVLAEAARRNIVIHVVHAMEERISL